MMQRALFIGGARSAPLLQRLDRSMSSVTIPPPACMLRPLEAPLRYLFGPGPSNVPPRILAAGGRPIIGHLHPEMYEVKASISSRAELHVRFCYLVVVFFQYMHISIFQLLNDFTQATQQTFGGFMSSTYSQKISKIRLTTSDYYYILTILSPINI